MGSPAADLRLSERLRPWVEGGVQFLFAPELAAKLRSGSGALGRFGDATRQAPHQGSYGMASSGSGHATQARSHHADTPPGEAASPAEGSPFAPPWDSYWFKTIRPSKVVFTYGQLALDLSGKGDRRRSLLFREILQHLRWAGRGIVSFWPVAPHGENASADHVQIFWQGVRLLQARHVVSFGLTSEQLDLPSDAAVFPRTGSSISVHLLPSPDELLAKLPHERHMASDSLKEIRFA